MWLGTLYVCLTSYDLFTYHFFHPGVCICHLVSLGTSVGILLVKFNFRTLHCFHKVEKDFRCISDSFDINSRYFNIDEELWLYSLPLKQSDTVKSCL